MFCYDVSTGAWWFQNLHLQAHFYPSQCVDCWMMLVVFIKIYVYDDGVGCFISFIQMDSIEEISWSTWRP